MEATRKAVVIGIDAATLGYLTKFSRAGLMPNMKQILETGFATQSFSSPPAGTAMNWATISTGAHVANHGVTAMAMRRPGDPLDKLRSGFFSDNCTAERLWEAGERAGKKIILLKYPGSWPPTINQGIQIGGFADPDWNDIGIAPRLMHSTRNLGRCVAMTSPPLGALPWNDKLAPKPARKWKNLEKLFSKDYVPPFEVEIRIKPTRGSSEAVFLGLLGGTKKDGYDRVWIFDSLDRDANGPCICLRQGIWSDWIRKTFETKNGKLEGVFRFKLIKLSEDGKNVDLYSSQVFPVLGWTVPQNIGSTLIEQVGPFQEVCYLHALYARGWIDDTTLFEEMAYQAQWMGKAAQYLLSTEEWDLFFTQCHWVDHMGHVYLGGTDPKCVTYSPDREKLCREAIQETYRLVDNFVGDILSRIDLNETLLVLTSDHGMLPVRSEIPSVNDILAKRGLLFYKRELMDVLFPLQTTGIKAIDWTRTKAAEVQGDYIYVNLKGREPHGIVEPNEYDEVANKVIDALLSYRNPETQDNPVALALKRKEAGFMGLDTPRVGDVIYFAKGEQSKLLNKINPCDKNTGETWFTGNHHGYLHSIQFQEEEWTMRAVTVFCGPGVKKGIKNKDIINLVDIVPTISYLCGIMVPNKSEGRILWEIMNR